VYEARLRFKEIFDTASDPATAEQQLAERRARTEALGLDFSKFWTTYHHWKTGILNYLDGHYTSAAVEGITNKSPRDHQTLLQGKVVRHALEAAEEWT